MNANYEQFFQLSLDLLCIAGDDGYFKELNPAWERALGFSLRELRSKPFIDFVHPDDRKSTIEETHSLSSGKNTIAFTNRYLTTQGDWRTLKWNAASLGGLIYAVARDITEEVAAEARKSEKELQLKSIAQHAPGMLYQFRRGADGAFSFPFVSTRASDIFEVSHETIEQRAESIIELIIPEDRSLFESALAETIAKLTPFRFEGRMRSPTGKLRWIRAASEPRQFPDGSILWDGIVVDVTSEKEAEALIQDQQAKMVNSSKLASLGEMAGGVAHEINNPLAILKGYASQIRKILESRPADTQKAIEATIRLDATVDRIARIVTGLRRVSRDSGQEEPVIHAVASLVSDTLSLCTERFRVHGIQLQISEIHVDWKLECRPVEISQVLLNLLNNSCDAIDGLKEKWIRLEVSENATHPELSVTDSGFGIPGPLRDKILMPFFTTKPIGRGTGLGLSISRSIVESHGGSLTLDADHDRTRFVVRLPKRQAV